MKNQIVWGVKLKTKWKSENTENVRVDVVNNNNNAMFRDVSTIETINYRIFIQ